MDLLRQNTYSSLYLICEVNWRTTWCQLMMASDGGRKRLSTAAAVDHGLTARLTIAISTIRKFIVWYFE